MMMMMMMMMKRIFATKRPLSKGKDVIEDSSGHHKLEGPIPKLDSAYHKKSKSHFVVLTLCLCITPKETIVG
jgi:hypothetical protein